MAEFPSARRSPRVLGSSRRTGLVLVALSVIILGQPTMAAVDPGPTAASLPLGRAEARSGTAQGSGAEPVIAARRAPKIFGPGIAIDSKSNRHVTGSRALAHRFRATTSSALVAILFQPRWGRGYSSGDGGRYRISIQRDAGRNGPSGRILASFTWDPGNKGNQGFVRRFTFPRPATLTRGRVYHVVFRNIHPRPDGNYISINETFTYEPLAPRHPRFPDGIYAVLNGTRDGDSGWRWEVDRHHMADMDLVYANGRHQGLAYLAALINDWAPIGGSRMVRERFTVPGQRRRVSGACVRVGRQAGDGPLTMTLETARGRTLASVRASTAQVARTFPDQPGDRGDWVCQEFGRVVVLQRGRSYGLRVSAPSDTQFSMTPILARDHTTDGKGYRMESYHFKTGVAERSSDGGRSWRAMYSSYPNNMQFYLRVR